MRTGPLSVVATAVSVVAATGLAAAPSPARPTAAPAPAAVPWTLLSSGPLHTSTSIAVARFGADLQVVWTQDVGAEQGLYTRIVSGRGTPRTAAIPVLTSAWQTINDFPAVIPYAGGRLITFSGLRTTDITDPYTGGYQYYLTSPDGQSWTLAGGALSASNHAYGSYGTDATVVAGQPVVAYTAATASRISYHQGIITPIPDQPADDPTTGDTGNDAYDTGVATDVPGAQTWAVWYSNAGGRTTEGVQAQRILPSLGPIYQGPGSAVNSGGTWSSVAVNERIEVAARTGGGLYAGYAVGYPTAARVALWRVGGAAMVIPGGGGVQLVGTAAGPGGRVWLYWWNANTGVIDAVRTDPGATRFGAVTPVPTPQGTTSVWDLEGDAAGGPLQLVVNAGSTRQQIFSTVVQPDLSVTASPASLAASKGGRLTVTVSDAGTAVSGAVVRFAGRQAVTGANGQATFTVAKGTQKGRYVVTVTHAGYATTTASATVN